MQCGTAKRAPPYSRPYWEVPHVPASWVAPCGLRPQPRGLADGVAGAGSASVLMVVMCVTLGRLRHGRSRGPGRGRRWRGDSERVGTHDVPVTAAPVLQPIAGFDVTAFLTCYLRLTLPCSLTIATPHYGDDTALPRNVDINVP
jgi:hypothetical protein